MDKDPSPTPTGTDMADLAIALGISAGQMRKWRREILTEGEDFTFAGNRTLVTPAGAEKLRAALGLPQAPEATPAPTTLLARVVSRPRVIRGARRFHYPNAAVISCAVPGREDLGVFQVRVRSSENYAPILRSGAPMMLEIAQDAAGQWRATGRAPRRPGQW